jgi:hypothetical protein
MMSAFKRLFEQLVRPRVLLHPSETLPAAVLGILVFDEGDNPAAESLLKAASETMRRSTPPPSIDHENRQDVTEEA